MRVRNPQVKYLHLRPRRSRCSRPTPHERQARTITSAGPWSPVEALRIASMPTVKRSDPRKLAVMKAKRDAEMSA